MADDPGWYRRLSPNEKQQLNQRFWTEGRLKLEPWLANRINHANIKLHPHTQVTGADAAPSGIHVPSNSGETLTVDHVVFATGYKVNLARVPFLANGLLSSVDVPDGFPVLDQHFQQAYPVSISPAWRQPGTSDRFLRSPFRFVLRRRSSAGT